MIKVRFYSDTNFSYVKDALEQYIPDIDITFSDAELTVSMSRESHLLIEAHIDHLMSDYSGDIYW